MTSQGQGAVIEFDAVTKVYPGAAAPSVDRLSLRIEAGEICALVGPSGSGKTTAMRMINRLIEPTQGEVRINGQSNHALPVEELRRSIGYVIQSGGLFPHRTILDNVGTVPRLLGWDERTIVARAREVLDLVGLSPDTYGARYPSQLSGGQRQRVGVARALAADPPLMLMDEPFGAIDPVVREKIQDEFLRLQAHVGKTIVIVTHDLDEAMRMGDKVAVLREGGVLAQCGTPSELLAAPADDFVSQFVGSDRALRRLSLLTIGEVRIIELAEAAKQGFTLYVDEHGRPVQWSDGSPVLTCLGVGMNLRSALSELLTWGINFAPVVDDAGRLIGVASSDVIRAALHTAAGTAAVFDGPHPAPRTTIPQAAAG